MYALFDFIFVVFHLGLICPIMYYLYGLVISIMTDNQDRLRLNIVSSMHRFTGKEPDPHNHRSVLVWFMWRCLFPGFWHLWLLLPGGGRCHFLMPQKLHRSKLRHPRLMHKLLMQSFLRSLEEARTTYHWCLYIRTMLLGMCRIERWSYNIWILWHWFIFYSTMML